MGAAADRETHTVLNACPQMQRMNGGIWLAIEYLTGRWANEQGAVWIVTGPVFTEASRNWIGDLYRLLMPVFTGSEEVAARRQCGVSRQYGIRHDLDESG
jgi:DNA/RNA endonuclease G (NUC1)